MKHIKNIALGLTLVAGSIGFSGCSSDYLDTVPTQSVSEETIAESLDNLMMAINGIHREMVSQESGYQCLGGEPGFMMSRDALADDMTWKTNSWMQTYLQWSANMNPNSGYNSQYWRIYYQWILNANKILEALETVPNTDAELYNRIKGEAL